MDNKSKQFGIRKTAKINTLKKLNEKFNYRLIDIEDMSTRQLTNLIYTIKQENGIPLRKNDRFYKVGRK